ncbi:MAG: type I 3-dehydroquinate dehydratase, partial [Candidatus Acidiferrum sp.]
MGLFGDGQDRLCAVAAAPTAAKLAALVRAGLRESHTIELRLDWLRSDKERESFLRWLKKRKLPGVTFIATCRRRSGGGEFPGDAQRELYWLIQAREAGCRWCDLECETIRELPGKSVREYAVPPKVLLSTHDFERMPPLPRVVRLPACGEVDAVKIAAIARTIGESLRLLRLARRSKNLVAVPMGEAGLPARILALREGSALAYAPIAAATAPGQVSLREMNTLYRAHELTRRTRVYGVIGDPVGHSLSPLMHNTAFVARKLDAVYLPFLVKDLRDFLKAVPELGVRGFSVTLPHKQAILKHLPECEPLAAQIGAVNTVVVGRDGSLYG